MQNNLFRWPKWSTDQGSQANHGNGGIHGQASISASGTAVHKHVRQHIRFSQENTLLKVHKNESVQKFRANHGTPANISEPSFQHTLVFWIKTAILWTKILCPFQRCIIAICEFGALRFRKICAPVKIKSALPPPQTQNTPPLKRGILWTWVFPAERTHFPGVHKICAAISGPRIAHTNFTDTRTFLRDVKPSWFAGGGRCPSPSPWGPR